MADLLSRLARLLGYSTVKYVFPETWRRRVDPASDLASWIGLVEVFFLIAFVLSLMVVIAPA